MNREDLVRRLLLAQTRGDTAEIRQAAEEFIAEEKRKKRHAYVRELEEILSNLTSLKPERKLTNISNTGDSTKVPRDRERGLDLVEFKEPQKEIDSLVLDATIRQVLDRILEENKRADLLKTFGLKPINKILFCGPPGCGKSVAAEAVAKALYLPFVLVRFDAVVSSFLGETAANLRKVFDYAKTGPMVIFFDEFDAIGKSRTNDEEHGEIKRVVNSFLQMLDSFRGDAITIAATNHQGLLDPALWRRFEEIVYFDFPNKEQIKELITRFVRQVGLAPDISLDKISSEMAGFSHADIERICTESIKSSVLNDRACIMLDDLKSSISKQKHRHEISSGVTTNSTSRKRSSSHRPKGK